VDKALKLAVLSAAIAVVDQAATVAGEYDEIDVMLGASPLGLEAANCLRERAKA
jgi:hypothetical protein